MIVLCNQLKTDALCMICIAPFWSYHHFQKCFDRTSSTMCFPLLLLLLPLPLLSDNSSAHLPGGNHLKIPKKSLQVSIIPIISKQKDCAWCMWSSDMAIEHQLTLIPQTLTSKWKFILTQSRKMCYQSFVADLNLPGQ